MSFGSGRPLSYDLGSGNISVSCTYDTLGYLKTRSIGNWQQSYNFDLYTGNLMERGSMDHEHLDDFGLINMNGRLYDPVLGRFLNADPVIQFPGFTQSYNSYSYVMNNPLRFTDPTGYTASTDAFIEAGLDNRSLAEKMREVYGEMFFDVFLSEIFSGGDQGTSPLILKDGSYYTLYGKKLTPEEAKDHIMRNTAIANASGGGGHQQELVAKGVVTSIMLFAGGGVGIEAGTIKYKGEEYGIVSFAVGGGIDISGGWNFIRIYADPNNFDIYDLEGAGGQGNASFSIIGGSWEAPSSGEQLTDKYRIKSWGWEIGPPFFWGGGSWTRTTTKILPPGKNPTLYDLYKSRPGGY
jgi:RHS repeat-associated protein